MPGEIECGQDYEEQEPVTEDASNNASPSFPHYGLLPLRQEALLFQIGHMVLKQCSDVVLKGGVL